MRQLWAARILLETGVCRHVGGDGGPPPLFWNSRAIWNQTTCPGSCPGASTRRRSAPTAARSFALYRSRKEAHVHAEAIRTALTEQYSAVADALGVLSEQLGRPGTPEPYKSGRVASFFTSLGAPPQECAVTLDDLGRTHAAVTLPRTRFSPAELAALAREVSGLCRRAFEPPQVLSCKGMTTLLFFRKSLPSGPCSGHGWGSGAGQHLGRCGPAVLQPGGGPDDPL